MRKSYRFHIASLQKLSNVEIHTRSEMLSRIVYQVPRYLGRAVRGTPWQKARALFSSASHNPSRYRGGARTFDKHRCRADPAQRNVLSQAVPRRAGFVVIPGAPTRERPHEHGDRRRDVDGWHAAVCPPAERIVPRGSRSVHLNYAAGAPERRPGASDTGRTSGALWASPRQRDRAPPPAVQWFVCRSD